MTEKKRQLLVRIPERILTPYKKKCIDIDKHFSDVATDLFELWLIESEPGQDEEED